MGVTGHEGAQAFDIDGAKSHYYPKALQFISSGTLTRTVEKDLFGDRNLPENIHEF